MQLQVEYVDISTIKPYKGNAKEHPKEQIEQIKKSMQEFGNIDPIGIWHNEIVEGHGRYLALKELGETQVPVIRLDDLTDEQRRAYTLVHNQLTMNSGFNLDTLKVELDNIGEIDMSEFGFDLGLEEDEPEPDDSKLDEAFNVVPTTVINGRDGRWQERKRAWIALGLKSEVGREDLKTTGALSGSVPGYYEKKEKCEAKIGRQLSNKDFEENYLQDYIPKNTTIAKTNSGGILSVFDPVLCETLYKWFAIEGGSVLDPFSGGSVRGVVASKLGLKYTGVDLRQKQVDANIEQGKELCSENMPTWLCGDSSTIDEIAPGEYDYVFSCPPYADLEKYSDDPRDISNMDYDGFMSVYRQIIKKSCDMLKDDRFACFVVGEVRDKKGNYYNFVGDTIKAFIDAGMSYYNEIILVTPMGSLPIRLPKQWAAGRKNGKTHQNILVFYKGNPKNIKHNYKTFDMGELEEMLKNEE